MNDLKMLFVKNSWSYVILQSEEASDLFYDRLFEMNPSLKALFKNDIKTQGKKLIDMITLMVSKLQAMDQMLPEINALARRHVQYGTKPEHYKMVGDALLATLENCLGERWDTETEQAWTELYAIWANAMIEAAAQP